MKPKDKDTFKMEEVVSDVKFPREISREFESIH